MSHATHAFTTNGRSHGEVKNPDLSPEEEIRRRLLRLDGSKIYSLILWAIPPGVPFDLVDLRKWPREYIQVAGSRDSMTVELRRIVEGIPQQCVVGHPVGRATELREADQIIHWNGCETAVLAGEVFDAVEAGDLFVEYYHAGNVPPQYSLRVLE